jgi:hypothetical protein
MLVYALRLRVLLRHRLATSFSVVVLGFGLNSALPFRMGELARLYYARQLFGVSTARLIAALLVEKFFDLTALAVLASTVVAFAQVGFIGKGVAITLIGIVIALYMALLAFHRFGPLVEALIARLPHFRPLLFSLRDQSRGRHIPAVAGCTAAIWVLNLSVVFLGMSGFLPDTEITLTDTVAIMVITALAVAVPSAPAGLGIFEAGVVAYLTQVKSVAAEPALSAALALHLAVSVPQMLLMLLAIMHNRLNRPAAVPASAQSSFPERMPKDG